MSRKSRPSFNARSCGTFLSFSGDEAAIPLTEKLVGELGSTLTLEGGSESNESFRGRMKPFAATGMGVSVA